MAPRDNTQHGPGSLRVILVDQPVESRPQGDGTGMIGSTRQVRVRLVGQDVELPFKPDVGRGSASLGQTVETSSIAE